VKHETQSNPEKGAPVDSDDPMRVGTWVAVEDGLPAMHEYVLVFPRRGIGVRTDKYSEDSGDVVGWHWETDGEGFTIERVTHWALIRAPGERHQKPDVEA